MFQNSKCRILKLVNDSYCRIYIHQVVVRKLFPIQLFKHGVQITEERTFLMRVFTVSQGFCLLNSLFENRKCILVVEVIKNSSIVMRGSIDLTLCKFFALFQCSWSFLLRQDFLQFL